MPGNIFSNVPPNPGMSMTAETIAENINSIAKDKRAATEFFIDGIALQQHEHAADPKQHARFETKLPIQQPILLIRFV